MRIYIRHAEKQYTNGKPIGNLPPHDPPILQSQYTRISSQAEILLTRGIPNRIYTSPFLRCRQTAEGLQGTIYKHMGIMVPVIVDREIGEYLGNQVVKGRKIVLTEETKQYDPYQEKNITEFRDRVSRYLQNTVTDNNRLDWYVTHGIFIKFISQRVVDPLEFYIQE